MANKIIKYPQPSLRKSCKEVTFPLSEEIKNHIEQLKTEIQTIDDGVALASNQIIENGWRIFVVKTGVDADLPKVVINPTWKPWRHPDADPDVHNMETKDEGCLSIPNFAMKLARYTDVLLEYQTEDGSHDHLIPQVSLGARIIQHECEHLDGKVILDHLDAASKTKAYNDIIRRRKRGQ